MEQFDLTAALRQHFGFTSFRVGQCEAIEHALARRDTLVVMPTGSGKSLCYQLPALVLDGTTIVISPLIALMKDQVDVLTASNKAATFINSTLTTQEQNARLLRLARGEYKLVYVAPERLRNADFLGALTQTRVQLLAVDEAHCISQWGHDFRPDYQHIREFIPKIGKPPVFALTATATPEVQSDILAQLGLARAERIVTGFNRPNLSFTVRYAPGEADKLHELKSLLAQDHSGIIYTGTRREAEEVAEFVNEVVHLRAAHYHAGLDDAERTRVQDAFMANEVPIIVATNAFGMGVDKSNIRFVIHYNLPSTVEAYYQEVGRAGRDGKPARGVLLYSPQDRALQEWFIENDAPTPEQTANIYRLLPRGVHRVSPFELQRETGLNDTRLELALRHLELAGALRRLGDERGTMLLEVTALARLDLAQSAAQVERHRERKRQKLAQIIRYAETNACRRRFILDYFGDRSAADAPECCDNHLAATAPTAESSAPIAHPALTETQRIPLAILDCVRLVSGKIGRTGVSKILIGSNAKGITHFKRIAYYARLAQFQRKQIDGLVSELIHLGYIRVIGGEYPVVVLSPAGAAAIKARAAIPLDVPKPPRDRTIETARAEKSMGTLGYTQHLIEQGLTSREIAKQRGLKENTIYEHLAQLIEEGSVDVDDVVDSQVQALVRDALARVTEPGLTAVKTILPESVSFGEIRCVIAARKAGQKGSHETATADAEDTVAKFLSATRPKPLRGPWRAGFALDFNSKFAGARWERTELGELVYRFKYAGDPAVAETLAARLAELIRARSELRADLIIPIPSTKKERPYDPVPVLARALGQEIRVPVIESVLVKTRATELQKAMTNLVQKQANVQGAFRVADGNAVRGKRILLLDDFYDSGATLGEATKTLLAANATEVCVLAATKTIHAD